MLEPLTTHITSKEIAGRMPPLEKYPERPETEAEVIHGVLGAETDSRAGANPAQAETRVQCIAFTFPLHHAASPVENGVPCQRW